MTRARTQSEESPLAAESGRNELTSESAAVEVRLLGGFELRDAAGQVVRLNTRKAEALLALLALQPGQPQARDKLCGLLWPEVRETQARHSLRQTLLQLRKALCSQPSPLSSDARGLQLTASGEASAPELRVDVARMQRCIELGTRAALQEALQCYRGELLEGLSVGEAPFEQWLRTERKRLREQLTAALLRLVELESHAACDEEALRVCWRVLQLDPLREEAHRSLMRLLAKLGRRAAALEHYRSFAATLRAQLGSEPDPLTQQLFAQLDSAPVTAIDRESADSARQALALAAPAPAALSSNASPASALDPQASLVTAGRARELQLLFSALQAAVKAQARVTLVSGEAGVGKTHLCDRVAHAAEELGFRVLRARSFESEQVLPLSLWANLLRDAITPETQLSRDERAELATLVPELSPEEPQTSDARRLFHAVRALITRLAQAAPVLLLLEDVHWVDEMSARLLSYLGRHQRPARCLILISGREEEMPAGSFVAGTLAELEREQLLTRVELLPLSHAETRELAETLAQRHQLAPLEAALAEQIWAISQGNPLVIVESVRALACGVLARDVTQLPVPERVRSLILNRIAKVSPAAREVLALAAVAGRELELDVLVSALEGTGLPLTAALDELARAQLVRAVEERVYFTHDRIRETLYSEMLPVSRRLLHGRVARALEQRADKLPATLGHIGYHFSKAGDAPAGVRYLRRFADLAIRDHGMNEALVALEQAYADSARLPEAERSRVGLEIVLRQAYCLISVGRFAELVERLRDLTPQMEALNTPQISAQFHFFWGFALTLRAERREAEAHAQRALDYATACSDERAIGHAHTLLAYLCQMTGRYRAGIAHGQLATKLLDGKTDHREAETIAWLSLGQNKLWLGEVPAALEATEKAALIAQAADNLRGQALAATAAGIIYAHTDQWELALEATQRGLKICKDPFTLVTLLQITAYAQSGSGQAEQASELLAQVVSQLDQHGMRAWCAHALTIFADAQLRAGNAARALELASEALVIANTVDDRACAGWAMRARGQALRVLGQRAAALEYFDRALALFEALDARLDTAKLLVERALLARDEHRSDAAERDLRHARELFSACGVSAPLAGVTQLLAAFERPLGSGGDSDSVEPLSHEA